MPKYRIVTDNWAGFEVQTWRWWWPFWIQGTTNTHGSVEAAEAYARRRAKRIVKNLGKL
jgi:hypothetical protein